MAITADKVIVELEARIQQYMANVGQAEAKFVGATNKIAASSEKLNSVTERAFGGSLSAIGKYSTGAQTSLGALQTGMNKFTGSFRSIQEVGGKFLEPTALSLAKLGNEQRKMAANVLASNMNITKSFETLSNRSLTSVGALNAGVDTFTAKIQDLPNLANRMQNPFVPFDRWFDNVNKNAYNLQFNLGNLTSQFNDIGVTAAAGMNPFIIALQQGTQLSQAFAGQRLDEVAKGIGESFRSIVSPTALVTIGLVAGAAALIQWGVSAFTAKDGTNSLEEAQKKLDKTTGDLSKTLQNLEDTADNTKFGDMTDEVRVLSAALAELDRVAELKNLKDTLKSAVSGTLEMGLIENIGAAFGGIGKAITSSNFAPDFNDRPLPGQTKYEKLTGGKGMPFEQFDASTKLIQTKALAGDVQGVLSGIQDILEGLANGGPVAAINSDLASSVATMGRAAIQVAEIEARYNGSAEAAKNAAKEAEAWLKIDEKLAEAAKEMAKIAAERVEATSKERLGAEQNLKMAEAELKYGKDSVQSLAVKRDIDRENLEIRLRASGLYEEDVQKLADIADKTEAISLMTQVWSGIVEGVAAAREKLVEQSARIAEKTAEELLSAQQALTLAQAAAVHGSESARYAEIKASIDRDNLATQLELADVSQTNIDAIIAIVAETDNVIAATSAWESAMMGVRGQIASVIADLASIGGGLIANASKGVEITALKEGKSRFEAAAAAKQYQEELKLRANEMAASNPYEKLIAAGQRQVSERSNQLDEELETERNAAQERERIANKAARGGSGGGGGGRKKKEDPRQTIYEQIEAFQEEAKMLDALSLSYGGYSSSLEIARKEEELLQALQKQSIEITPEVAKEVRALAEAYVVASDAAKLAEERHTEFQQRLESFKNTAENAFTGLITGAMTLKDALGSVIQALAQMFAHKAFQYIMNPAGSAGGGMGGGSFLSNLLGGLGLAEGGYTGSGSKYEPAGIVHKGEVVWSQADVRRAGGVGIVEAMRKFGSMPGLAGGGVAGNFNMPSPSFGRGSQSGKVQVVAVVDDSGNIHQVIRRISGEVAVSTVKTGIQQYDSGMPGRVKQISQDPRKK